MHKKTQARGEPCNERAYKRVHETVMFNRILVPMAMHASAGIYAPDTTVWKIFCWMRENMSVGNCPKLARVTAVLKKNWAFVLFVVVAGIGFKLKGKWLTDQFKEAFFGWAIYNQKLSIGARCLSISGMMIVRLLLSNVFPFTSPAFAFLIGLSSPPGEEWMGTLFLLGCSMPAGALTPFLDWLLHWLPPKPPKEVVDQEDGPANRFDYQFRATRAFSAMTDHLPFSFWVRPLMESTFKGMKALETQDESAAAGAVLMGHFMIWAGPATTMYQRLFVPDVVTCILVQPLGLLEDVLVTLAAWAASSPKNEKGAELALYFFMMTMNLVHLQGLYAEELKQRRARTEALADQEQLQQQVIQVRSARMELLEHMITFFIISHFASYRYFCDPGIPRRIYEKLQSQTTPTSTTTSSTQGNLHPHMMLTAILLVWVSCIAVLSHLGACLLTGNIEWLVTNVPRLMSFVVVGAMCSVLYLLEQ